MIGVVATRTLLTVEQFEQLSEEEHYRYELDHGELVEVACATYEHNEIRGVLEHALRAFLAAHRVGRVIAEQEFRLVGDTVRRPDVAFLRAEVASRIDKSKSILDVVPDLVAEIVSPNDTAAIDAQGRPASGSGLPVCLGHLSRRTESSCLWAE
jgi:Uma2 family endonuclease